MPWYFFAAATPILYSFTNYIDKFLVDKKIKDPLVMTSLAGVVSGILGLSIGFIKGFEHIGLPQTLLIMLAGILLIFYLLPYYKAIKVEDASRVVPLFSFIPVFTLILSAIFLRETLQFKQIIGLLLVVFAGVFISAEKIEGKLFKPRKSLWFMLLSSLMYGSIGILFRLVVKEADFWTVFSYEYMGTGIGGIMLLLIPRIRRGLTNEISMIKKSAGIITLNNIVSVLAQMSESYAVSLVAVPLVNIVGGIQPLITLLEGMVLTLVFPKFIKEDIRKETVIQKLIAIVFIFGGLYFVYF